MSIIFIIYLYHNYFIHSSFINIGKNFSLLLQEAQLYKDKIVGGSINSIEPLLSSHRLSSSSSSIHSSSYLMALSYNNNDSDDDHLYNNNNNNHTNFSSNNGDDDNNEVNNRYFHVISSRNNSDSYSNKFQINNQREDNVSKGDYDNNNNKNDNDKQQIIQFSPLLLQNRSSNDSFITTNTNVVITNNNNNNNTSNLNNNNNNIYQKEDLIQRTPWKQFFTHPIALSIYLSSFGFGWIGYTLLSEMPSYLTDVLGFDLQSAGILCIFPYIALFISTISYGYIFNYLQVKYLWTSNTVRIVAMLLTYVGSSIILVICAFQENKYAAYTFMIISQVCLYE